MRKFLCIIICLSVLCFSGCFGGSQKNAEKEEIIVFAASSMTDTLSEIEKIYEKENSHSDIIFNFDSTGTLRSQIKEGADCDLFISASEKDMDILESEDLIYMDTRVDLLLNKAVFIVPKENPAGINGYEDIIDGKFNLMAIGNIDVPAGMYAKEILTYLGVWESFNESGKITFSSNVREVLSQVEEAAADCGIVYITDIIGTDSESVIVGQAPEKSHRPIIYPVAIVNKSENYDEAEKFLSFLKSDEAKNIFEKAGFIFIVKE